MYHQCRHNARRLGRYLPLLWYAKGFLLKGVYDCENLAEVTWMVVVEMEAQRERSW
jgi:hypothetical protein